MDALILVIEGLMVAGILTIAYLQRTLKSYAEEKGKNLATREDIAAITDKVEAVKAEYAKQIVAIQHGQTMLLEQSNQRHQLSMAAIERRLQTHQEAFAKSAELVRLAHDSSLDTTERLNEMLQWYRENCLYLSPEAGRAFMRACHAAHVHQSLLDGGPAGSGLVLENWSTITAAPEIIAAAVQLPGIGIELVKSAELKSDS